MLSGQVWPGSSSFGETDLHRSGMVGEARAEGICSFGFDAPGVPSTAWAIRRMDAPLQYEIASNTCSTSSALTIGT